MAFHKSLVNGDIHTMVAFTFGDAGTRTSYSAFEAGDVGKVVFQADDSSFWIVQSTTPAYVSLGGDSSLAAQAYAIAVAGTNGVNAVNNTAISALNTAWVGTLAGNQAYNIAVSGLNTAWVGTNGVNAVNNVAISALNAAWVGTNAANAASSLALQALNTAWAGTAANDNFKDSPDNADAIIYTNGSNERARWVGASGNLQLIGGTRRIHTQLTTDMLAVIAGASKTTGAFIEMSGQDGGPGGNVGASLHHQSGTLGTFYVRSAPYDSTLSMLKFQVYGQTGNTEITNTWASPFTENSLSITVTDTASTSMSNVLKCTVNGNEKLTVRKTGDIQASGTLSALNVSLSTGTTNSFTGSFNSFFMGTYAADLSSHGYQIINVTGSLVVGVNTASLTPGAGCTMELIHPTNRDVSVAFENGIRFVGSKPTSLTASKISVLSFTSFGSATANVVGAYAAET